MISVDGISKIDDSSYFKYFPFMSNGPGEKPDGNSLLYLGTRIVILGYLKLLSSDDVNGFIDAVNESSVAPGLLNRGYKPGDQQAHDDYIGVCAGSHASYNNIALDVAEYGFKNDWVYKNTDVAPINKRLSFEFWRIPGVVQHIKICGGVKLNILDQIFMAISLISTTFIPRNETSCRILDWLKIQSFKGKDYLILNIAKWLWEIDLSKKYPHKMGDVFGLYFSPEHPFAIYMKDKT